ncbi:hypothetical protein T02_8671 [Trichinella nativa]|uniref:Uncharacterized protein n=1 Tax=Trichinella nativa TaxID=6335 RepID=A0A0V1LHI7_9BILA|nr:hypothetical protein T02_8671 [Trichinella nativa]
MLGKEVFWFLLAMFEIRDEIFFTIRENWNSSTEGNDATYYVKNCCRNGIGWHFANLNNIPRSVGGRAG